MRRSLFLPVALLLGAAPPAAGQGSDSASAFQEIDRIAAVVGDSVIPMSRLEEELNVFRQQGGQVPEDPQERRELMRQVLDNIVNQQLILQAALRDTSIVVTEQEIQSAVDRAYREVREQFASELEFRRQLETSNFGTPEEYRRWLADQKRTELMRDQLLQRMREQGDLTPLAPTEGELREFYEQSRGQQQRRPATVSFRQVVLRVEPDSAALDSARAVADSLVVELRDDADFAVAARRFSQDPGSREQGGELGWVRRGNFVPQFEAMAFRLRPGQISEPVLTVFGYHIIEVQRAQAAEIQVRHILIRPALTEADREQARSSAEAVAQALIDGAPFDSLAEQYHDYFGQEQVVVEDFPREQLPQNYRDALTGATEGDVIGPLLLDQGDGRPKYVVLRVEEMRPEGEYSFEDLRDQMRNVLSEQNAMRRFLESLRGATYVETRL
jgi:peptidyl-prolyl cis-trans isomerase SurA